MQKSLDKKKEQGYYRVSSLKSIMTLFAMVLQNLCLFHTHSVVKGTFPSHQILLVNEVGQAFVTTISLQATLGLSDPAIVEEASSGDTLFETNGKF